MTVFQRIACQIDLGGNRDSVVVRNRYDPDATTFPEYVLLQFIHGGSEHVHHVMSVGTVERTDAEEVQRLIDKYGNAAVQAVFPGAGATTSLPAGNDLLPTEEEVLAGEDASRKARSAARAKRNLRNAPPVPGLEHVGLT
jgi:hypothetical protein